MNIKTQTKDLSSEIKELNKLRLVFEQTTGAIIILDKNFRFEYVNPSFERLSEYSRAELIGHAVADIFSHEDLPQSNYDLHMTLLNGEKWEGELHTFTKSGSTYWSNAVATPYKDDQGVIEGYIVIQQDITEKRKMQEALTKSEQKYRELAEMLPLAVYELDVNGSPTYMNITGLELFGIARGSGKGRNAVSFFNPEDNARMRQKLKEEAERILNHQDGVEAVASPPAEYTARRTDGSEFPVLIYGTAIVENGVVTGSRGIIVDISERKAMENALRESEEKYRSLIENATDGIVIVQNGLLKFANQTMCDIMKYSMDELVDKPFLDYIDQAEHESLSHFHTRRMEGEQFSNILRSRFIRKGNQMITVELNARTSDYNGAPAGFIIIRDITERLKIENELQIAKNELEKLNSQLEKRVKESSKRLTETRTQLINLQKENLQTQYDVLKQQVNPHFLFNSLNVLTSLIKLEPDLAEKFSEQLSKVYRYILENKDNELVDLQTELHFLDAYLFLLNIRFIDKLKVNIDIPEKRRFDKIIPLAMQLLIENAIKHNIMSKSKPLEIDIFIDKENRLNIINNLQERPSQIVSTGVGLKNIQKRYQLLNNSTPVFEKTSRQFIAKVPLIV